MTLNSHFELNSVLRRYVWALKHGFRSLATFKLVLNVVGERTLNRKERLRHRAVSLRHHNFLVNYPVYSASVYESNSIVYDVKNILMDWHLVQMCLSFFPHCLNWKSWITVTETTLPLISLEDCWPRISTLLPHRIIQKPNTHGTRGRLRAEPSCKLGSACTLGRSIYSADRQTRLTTDQSDSTQL